MSETITPQRQAVVDRVERELLSGATFALIERSHGSAPRGGGPISAIGYGKVIETLGRFAARGDWHTAAVREAIVTANPYVTGNEVVARVAQSLASFVRGGYFDTVRATGPEASRPSAHWRAITLRQAIVLRMLMAEVEEAAGFTGSIPTVGWCVEALMEREGIAFDAVLFPLHARRRAC